MELKRYWALIWRWLWLIVLGILVAGISAYLVSSRMTPVYSASSRLLIDQAPGSSSGNEYSQVLLEQRLAFTYIELLKTRPVLEETIIRLGLPLTAAQLDGMISVSAPQDTQIIVLTVQDTNPQRAADIANELGAVFVDSNQERQNRRYAEPISNWQQRQVEIGDEIEALETEISTLGTPGSAAEQSALSRLEVKLNETQIRYTEAFNNLNDLQVAQAKESSNIVQVEPAKATSVPIRPRTTTNTLLAAVTGGMLALGIIFLIEYLDDTVKTPDQLAADSGLSTLAAIAEIKANGDNRKLITVHTPRDPISEAYRVLRTNLGFAAIDSGLRSVLVTSSSPGEGKSTTAANLAVVAAQTGKRVILLDADLRRPTQHKLFDLPNNRGLTTAVFYKDSAVGKHSQATEVQGLSVITSGPLPPNPSELLSSNRMHALLKELESEADMLIIDSPPVLTVADAAILATQVGGTVLVVEVGKTRREAFVEAVNRIHKSSGTIYGAVMNLLKPKGSGYYYYDYYYHSHYYDNDESDGKRLRKKRDSQSRSWRTLLGRQ